MPTSSLCVAVDVVEVDGDDGDVEVVAASFQMIPPFSESRHATRTISLDCCCCSLLFVPSSSLLLIVTTTASLYRADWMAWAIISCGSVDIVEHHSEGRDVVVEGTFRDSDCNNTVWFCLGV